MQLLPPWFQNIESISLVAPWFQNRLVGITQDHQEGSRTWVRMHLSRGPLRIYVGDVALAIAMGQPGIYEFWLIPQPILTKQPGGVRPMQMLFDADFAAAEYGSASVAHKNKEHIRYHFCRNDYSGKGFLVLCGPSNLAASFGGQILPSTREIELFAKCEAMEYTFQLTTQSRIACETLQRGDRVKGIGRTLQGITGIVQDLSKEKVTIHLPSLDILETIL